MSKRSNSIIDLSQKMTKQFSNVKNIEKFDEDDGTNAQLDFSNANISRFSKRSITKFILTHKLLLSVILALAAGGAAGFYGGKMFQHFQHIHNFYYPLWNPQTQSMDPIYYGQWEAVVPNNNISASWGEMLGMQTVHSLLLPNGKILVASGSSWRNRKDLTDVYPQVENPRSTVGLFNASTFKLTGNVEQNKKKLYQYFKLTNNVGIYDPEQNTFFRIPHPITNVSENSFQPNDFFCIGHNHLPDGNPLFTGGTQYYFPWRSGARTMYIFNWTKEDNIDWKLLKDWGFANWDEVNDAKTRGTFYPWQEVGLMTTGRWYPSLIPLQDGQMVIVSGFVGQFNNNKMFRYEINPYVQIFNYKKFKQSRSTKDSLLVFNAKDLQNSPYKTELQKPPPASNCSVDHQNYDNQTFYRMCNSYKYEAFKLYPQDYLIKQNTIFMTQQGDWNSLREQRACCNRQTNKTYYMNFVRNQKRQIINITFKYGPQRREDVSMSGTSILYKIDQKKNSSIYIFGGMNMMLSGTALPGLLSIDAQDYSKQKNQQKVQYAGSRGTRKLEVFSLTQKLWEQIQQKYMGITYDYDRTMHYSIILPTKQILIINGGNYDYFAPVFSPLLLTPFYNQTTKKRQFNKTFLAPARIGKLYHNIALLTRTGSILTSGGNAARALINANEQSVVRKSVNQAKGQFKYNPNQVDLTIFFRNQSTYAKGFSQSPAQSQRMQIFRPPYLFIDPQRETYVQLAGHTQKQKTVFNKKTYYLIKSKRSYSLNVRNNGYNKSSANPCPKSSIVLLKLGSSTHGWDSGQKLYSIPFSNNIDYSSYQFETPSAKEQLIVPAFYHLFYVDCKGKPAKSLMVRFDDTVQTPL